MSDFNLDLICLVADSEMRSAIDGILRRSAAIPMAGDLKFRVFDHPHRDSGCRREAEAFLDPFLRSCRHALVVFDQEGSGPHQPELEAEIEGRLERRGWIDRAAVVVIDPELESWVWSDSPHVSRTLGWDDEEAFRRFLEEANFLRVGQVKPARPKEAVEAALKERRLPRSSAIYRDLAKNVGFDRCQDQAFQKLRRTLARWFPPITSDLRR